MSGATLASASQPVRSGREDLAVALREVFCVHRTNEGDAAALQGTTLDIRPGEIVCVLGPSGAGKSTLLRVIAGLEVPSAGEVSVFGRDIGRLPDRARSRLRHTRIGFLGQTASMVVSPDLRVSSAVALPLALRGVPRAGRSSRARELLEAAGLGDRADAFAAELSGGERQRVALCVALAHRPSLLLADEPTGELDSATAGAVRRLIADLARAHGATAILVSHDPATAEIADRALRIRDGRVVEDHRDGQQAIVVGRGGWLRLPPELLAQAGIEDRARVALSHGALTVTAAGGPAPAEPEPPTTVQSPPDWSPVRLELCSLSRGYGAGRSRRRVLDALSLTLAAGQLTVVTGRSGSGKTTLLRLLAGLDVPDSGALVFDGDPVEHDDPEQRAARRRTRVGYLPQEPVPVGFLSAEENVVLALRMRGWELQPASERAAVALARVGLADRARQRVSRLSAGEAQRVALARALAGARGLLIVDEPTSRLDEANAAAVAGLLHEAAAQDRQTVLCATHDPEVINRADQVVAL